MFKDFLIPLAGVGVPLLLFYLGIKQERERSDQRRIEDLDKSDRIENLGLLYFHSLLKQALDHCCHLSEVLSSTMNALKANKYYSEDLEIDGDEVLKRIVIDLDRESLFYAYRMRIDDQSLNAIFRGLDAAHGLRDTYIQIWTKTNGLIVNKMNEIRSSTSSLGIRIGEVEISDETDLDLRRQLMGIFVQYSQREYSKDKEYQKLVENLANPFASTIEDKGKWRMRIGNRYIYKP